MGHRGPLGRRQRSYTAEDVIALRGRVVEEYTLARLGAERLWDLLQTQDYVNALGALTGNQAVQMVKAGLKAIYLSGLAGRGGRQPGRSDLPGPVPLSGELGARRRAPDQQRAGARRPDRLQRGPVRAATRTSSRRSSPTPRRASAARSTRSS